jgi:hypothetical protein
MVVILLVYVRFFGGPGAGPGDETKMRARRRRIHKKAGRAVPLPGIVLTKAKVHSRLSHTSTIIV